MSDTVAACWVPGLPLLLSAEKSPHWKRHAEGLLRLRERVEKEKPDALVIFSTQWLSVLGISFLTLPHPKGTHVDENWYEWGDLDYDFPVDADLGSRMAAAVTKAGMPTKTVAFEGFPIDTGTLVALRFLDPKGMIPVSVVSSWVYADSEKNRKLGQAMREEVLRLKKRVMFVASSLLSTRFATTEVDPQADRIDPKDDEWNQKILAQLEGGNLSKVAELVPEFTKTVPTDMQFSAFHWLHGVLGDKVSGGRVLSYGPIWGTGAAVIDF